MRTNNLDSVSKSFPYSSLFIPWLVRLLYCVLGVSIASTLSAQEELQQDTISWIRTSSLIPIPIVFYTPETRFGAGGALLYAFRFRNQSDEERPSQFQLGSAYTQERQILLYFPFQVFTKNQAYNIKGELGYYRYVYRLYGIGNETPEDLEERFQANFPRV